MDIPCHFHAYHIPINTGLRIHCQGCRKNRKERNTPATLTPVARRCITHNTYYQSKLQVDRPQKHFSLYTYHPGKNLASRYTHIAPHEPHEDCKKYTKAAKIEAHFASHLHPKQSIPLVTNLRS